MVRPASGSEIMDADSVGASTHGYVGITAWRLGMPQQRRRNERNMDWDYATRFGVEKPDAHSVGASTHGYMCVTASRYVNPSQGRRGRLL